MEDFIFDLQRFESAFSGGNGTETDPYKISNPADLQTLATDVNAGTGYSGYFFKVTADIDLKDIENFTAIGTTANSFKGTFDGYNYTISNLTINSTNDYQGLFGYVQNGVIQNVNLTNVDVTGKDNVGAVVGEALNSTITNCTADGTVKATANGAYVGGLVGFNRNGSTVEECSFSGDVKYTAASAYVGGVVGCCNGTVKNSAFLGGTIDGTTKGAIFGNKSTSGTLTDNYYYGDLKGVNDNGATELKRKFTVPSGVTCKGDGLIQFGNTYGSTSADSVEVTFTYDGNDYKYTVSENKITVEIKDSKLYVNNVELSPASSGSSGGDSGSTTVSEGLTFSNKAEDEKSAEEIAKKAQKATSVTLQSDFEGTIINANEFRKLTTIKAAKNFTSDIEIIGNTKANVISSGAGDDTITGGTGADKIDGGAGDDTITGGTGKDTLTGGAGADVFVYADGDGRDVIKDYSSEDTLQIDGTVRKASVSGKKVVLKVGSGSITLEKAVGQKITVDDGNGNTITNIYRAEGQYDEYETSLKIFSTFSDTFKASAYKNLETIDGGAVKFEAIEIVGNDRDNSITGGSKRDNLSGGKGSDSIFGGKGADYLDGGTGDDSLNGGTGFDTLFGGAGNDTLTGGAGQNVFVYESGDDVITDYGAGTANKIQLLNDSVTTDYNFSGNDLTLNFDNGSLTIKQYDGREVKFLDAKGKENSYVFTADALLNANQTSATLTTNNFTAGEKLITIDARQIDGSVNVEGNERANKIYANDDGGTYTGGGGNDKFWGGAGADTFIYADGDGRDIIYGFDDNDALEINGLDEITATYNAEKNYVRFKCGNGSIKLQDFTATEFAVNNDTWTLSGNTLTKK